jgi:hypothetical protein
MFSRMKKKSIVISIVPGLSVLLGLESSEASVECSKV